MPRAEFEKLSYGELADRVAFGFVTEQNRNGIGWRKGELYFNGKPVCTDERLQKMYNACYASQKCMERFGCNNVSELERKQLKLQARLEEVKVKLRKERKIETSYRNRLAQKRELVDA